MQTKESLSKRNMFWVLSKSHQVLISSCATNRIFWAYLGQCQACLCSGFLCHQVISSCDIVCVTNINAPLPWGWISTTSVDTMRPWQNGHHFADIFKSIVIKISLNFVPKWSVNNIPALVQIMAWLQPGNKPLPESMIAKFGDTYMHLLTSRS